MIKIQINHNKQGIAVQTKTQQFLIVPVCIVFMRFDNQTLHNGKCKPRVLIGLQVFVIKTQTHEWRHKLEKVLRFLANRELC